MCKFCFPSLPTMLYECWKGSFQPVLLVMSYSAARKILGCQKITSNAVHVQIIRNVFVWNKAGFQSMPDITIRHTTTFKKLSVLHIFTKRKKMVTFICNDKYMCNQCAVNENCKMSTHVIFFFYFSYCRNYICPCLPDRNLQETQGGGGEAEQEM